MKKYLGIDLGSKTIGLAISESGIIAHSLTTYRFRENEYQEAKDMIIKVIDEHQITDIVLGYPKHMNNDIGIRGKISEDMKNLIIKERDVNVVLWDERLSTKSAISTMIQGKQSRNKQKQKKDELAAVFILQNYLDYKGDH
ncbi:MAG: Holliday junction resolvase RuvX [Acholeplasmataceae bacterium]